MGFDSKKHHRRSIRMNGYDYSQAGAYFVTICTQDRAFLFGEVVEGSIRLNDAGRMVQSIWSELSTFYPGVETDEFVVMPNHVHGIVLLTGAASCPIPEAGQRSFDGEEPRSAATGLSLPDVIHRFKSLTTMRYAAAVKELGWRPFSARVWQRNYYEHVIRGEGSLNRIRQYILDNPIRWTFDRENPSALAPESEDAWRH